MTTLTPNSPAPAFEAVDQHGAKHSLADYTGKWVLLYFYPKDDTPGCTIEACGFRDNFSVLQKEIDVIGVSADSAESHQEFIKKYDLPFTLLADTDKKVIAAYEATNEGFGKRVSFIIDPVGNIRKIYTNIEATTHAGDILKDLHELKNA
ncbi:MAG: peroxiredoxin [Candidatus Peribacteraceae bacterium]|nr:peroxiredoxin [Candidatus Peribacteraceae bacterium]